MMRRAILGALCALLTLFGPAQALAALGTPTALGSGSGAAGIDTNAVITTATNTAPIGSLVVVAFSGFAGGLTVSGVSDSGSNTWHTLTLAIGTSQRTMIAWSVLTTALAPGSTITTSWNSNSGTKLAVAGYVTGTAASPADIENNASATNTAPTITSGSPTTTPQMAFVASAIAGSNAFTQDAGFNPLQSASSASKQLFLATKSLSPAAAFTHTASLGGGSVNWTEDYATFKEAVAAGASTPRGLLLGVGQ